MGFIERTDEQIRQHIKENVVVDSNGCWIWQKSFYKCGYAKIRRKGQQNNGHRISYAVFKGEEIPSGMYACHKCDVRSCVNPDHIFIGTAADNNLDRDKKGRTVSNAKVKGRDLDELIDLMKTRRFTFKELGSFYGLSVSAISQIANGKGRKGLTEKINVDEFSGNPNCRRCGRLKASLKAKPVNGFCNSCYHYFLKRKAYAKRGHVCRKYVHKKKFDLSIDRVIS